MKSFAASFRRAKKLAPRQSRHVLLHGGAGELWRISRVNDRTADIPARTALQVSLIRCERSCSPNVNVHSGASTRRSSCRTSPSRAQRIIGVAKRCESRDDLATSIGRAALESERQINFCLRDGLGEFLRFFFFFTRGNNDGARNAISMIHTRIRPSTKKSTETRARYARLGPSGAPDSGGCFRQTWAIQRFHRNYPQKVSPLYTRGFVRYTHR